MLSWSTNSSQRKQGFEEAFHIIDHLGGSGAQGKDCQQLLLGSYVFCSEDFSSVEFLVRDTYVR